MLNKKALSAARIAAGTTTDPDFEYVTMLLHGDGTNGAQNNTFTDGSTNNFTVTRNGNTTQGTFSPYSPGWSNYFDGTGDYLEVANNTALQLTGDFSIECWVYVAASTGGNQVFISKWNGSSQGYIVYYNNFNGKLEAATTAVSLSSSSSFAFGTWNHVALARTGSTYRLYLNGSSVASATSSSTATDSGTVLQIGRNNQSGDNHTSGYISNVRVIKGTGGYDASQTSITVPTSALTAITNTSLLTCQSNRFIDNSSNGFTITRNGDVRVQPFNPFSPAAAYSAGTNGGSGYFDGTGDFLSFTGIGLDGDFCLEAWFYRTAKNSGYSVVFGGSSSSGSNNTQLQIFNDGGIGLALNATQVIASSGTAFIENAWNHVAAVRTSSTVSVYVNGSRQGTATYSTNGSITSRIGDIAGLAGYNPIGYISNARVVVGSSVYDATQATLTVPTAPLTAITNTSLLLNFTNGAIIDNAMDNVLETVGNAQISTSVKKFGTGSLSFDGTGDWLLVPDTPDIRLGSGKFTVELWVYLNATGAARGLIGKGTGTTGWLISTNSSNNVVFTYGSSTITSTGTLAASTWYHIAVVREGTGTNQTKIYIDGTNDGTGTVTTNFNQTNAMYIGANRTGGDALNGYIDDLRITAGTSRYTANFTPPTAAFPDL